MGNSFKIISAIYKICSFLKSFILFLTIYLNRMYFTYTFLSWAGLYTMESNKRNTEKIKVTDQEYLLQLAGSKMPFGKYKGVLLIDLPEPYVVWFSRKGFPKGKLGEMLQIVYEIKLNGLEYLFKPFR